MLDTAHVRYGYQFWYTLKKDIRLLAPLILKEKLIAVLSTALAILSESSEELTSQLKRISSGKTSDKVNVPVYIFCRHQSHGKRSDRHDHSVFRRENLLICRIMPIHARSATKRNASRSSDRESTLRTVDGLGSPANRHCWC